MWDPSRRERCDRCLAVEVVDLVRRSACYAWAIIASYRTLRDGSLCWSVPGTSCQATFIQSLRDISPAALARQAPPRKRRLAY